MSTLHTVNKSPFDQRTLHACIDVCQPGDAILLIEDGVYGALHASPEADALQRLMGSGVEVFALKHDLQARGLLERTADTIQVVGYTEFVTLCVTHKTVQSWY